MLVCNYGATRTNWLMIENTENFENVKMSLHA